MGWRSCWSVGCRPLGAGHQALDWQWVVPCRRSTAGYSWRVADLCLQTLASSSKDSRPWPHTSTKAFPSSSGCWEPWKRLIRLHRKQKACRKGALCLCLSFQQVGVCWEGLQPISLGFYQSCCRDQYTWTIAWPTKGSKHLQSMELLSTKQESHQEMVASTLAWGSFAMDCSWWNQCSWPWGHLSGRSVQDVQG